MQPIEVFSSLINHLSPDIFDGDHTTSFFYYGYTPLILLLIRVLHLYLEKGRSVNKLDLI